MIPTLASGQLTNRPIAVVLLTIVVLLQSIAFLCTGVATFGLQRNFAFDFDHLFELIHELRQPSVLLDN